MEDNLKKEKKTKKRKQSFEGEDAAPVDVESTGLDESQRSKKKKKKADQPTEAEAAAVSDAADKIDWAALKLAKAKRRQEKQAKLDEEAKADLKAKQAEKENREKANEALKKKGKLTKKQKYLAAKAAKKAQAKGQKQDTAKASFRLEEALASAKLDRLDPKAVSCFLTGLPYLATEKHISDHFADVGPCTVQLLRDSYTGRSNGTGFVNFNTAEEALRAISYTGSKIQGRWIKVRLCEPRDTGVATGIRGPGEKPEGCLSVVIKCDKSISERSLWKFFSECDVSNVSCMMDRETGEFRGTAFMDFEDTAMVDKAVKKSGSTIKGHVIHVRYKMEKKVETPKESSGRVAAHNKAAPVPPPAGKVTTFQSESDSE